MTIDPMNAPIFGDVVHADPPRPVRLATALLLGNVVLAAGYRMLTAFDAGFTLFLIPLLLSVWFALSMRVGRHWARTASTVLSCLLIAMLALMSDYAVPGLAVLALSSALLLTAMRFMWRSDVHDYFAR